MPTTNEIADKIAAEHGLGKAKAKLIIDSILAEITRAATSGTETKLAGFGKFKVKEMAARQGRNPATGERSRSRHRRNSRSRPQKP